MSNEPVPKKGTSSQSFSRAISFFSTHLLYITITVSLVQMVSWIVDMVVFSGNPKLPWLPLIEGASPWILLPFLRMLFGRESIRKTLSSPYLELVGAYFLVIAAMTTAFILAFQILNWFYHGEMHGGLFYFPSLVMVFCWALRRSPD